MIGAIDLGGTKVAVALARRDGRLVEQARFPTDPARGPEAVIAEMVATLRALTEKHGVHLSRVGVGSVGPLDLETGTLKSPPNFKGWDHVPLKAPLEAALGVPVVVDNDANAAALAEYRFGAGEGAECLVFTTISTGIGGGIVLDGRLLHGVGGGAGELGHQCVAPGGPLCGCGASGCLEAVASGPAVVRAAREVIASGQGPRMLALAGGDWDALHAGHVAQAAAEGEPAAQALWEAEIGYLATGFANVVSILAPDRLVIGGGVAQAGALLFEPLKAELARRVTMVPMDRVAVVPAAFGADAGVVGAIALALGDGA